MDVELGNQVEGPQMTAPYESISTMAGFTPAEIRSNPMLPDGAKTLYSELSAMTCGQNKYAWASNKRLGRAIGRSARSVSRWISMLQQEGYVDVDFSQDGDDCVRKITLYANFKRPETKKQTQVDMVGHTSPTPTTDGTLPLDSQGAQRETTKENKEDNTEAKVFCEEITAYWNSKKTLTPALRTTPSRLRAVSARSKDKLFVENWKRCIDYYAASEWHCGKNKDNWSASLSWFLEPDRVVKLLERIGTAPVSGSSTQVYRTIEQARMMLQPGEDTTLEDGTFFRKADKDNMVFELIVKP